MVIEDTELNLTEEDLNILIAVCRKYRIHMEWKRNQ